MITKTNFIQYINCPRSLWLSKFRKDLKPRLKPSEQFRIDQGYEVEELARKLFDGGVSIEDIDWSIAVDKTKPCLDSKDTIYQASVVYEDLAVRSDIVVYNEEEKGWDIYEVKSSTEIDKDHIYDVAFQKYVFEKAGYVLANTCVVYLNKEYVRNGEVAPEDLFIVENVSDVVEEKFNEIELLVDGARKILERDSYEDVECGCTLSSSEYPEYCFGDLPKYSVHNLLSRSAKKREDLLSIGVVDVKDIPEDYDLTDRQNLYYWVYKNGDPHIEEDQIKERLDGLEFPLYFLDYETVSVAIPPYDGYKPYQQIVFQYSLHVMDKEGNIEHYEYVSEEKGSDPSLGLLEGLNEVYKGDGTVVVWNDSFERKRNEEMAELHLEYKDMLLEMNARMFDLMKIFSEQLYVHPEFFGSYSIKKVLPVLVTELKYDDLEIGDGMTASLGWYEMFLNGNENQNLVSNLKEYCKLDTLAMVEVYEVLKRI